MRQVTSTKNITRGPIAAPEVLVGLEQPGVSIPPNFAEGFLQAMIKGSLTDITHAFKG